jgi:hypothetical protein
VLTRLPGDARLRPEDAALLLRDRFGAPVALKTDGGVDLLDELARHDIAGGAVYDAVIGITARDAGGTLLTRDRRAAATYSSLGVTIDLVA